RVDDQVDTDLPFLLNLDPAEAFRRPVADVLLVEARLVRALGTAHQRGRPVLQVRQNPFHDRLVEAREIELGRSVSRIEDPVGMREPYAGHGGLLVALRDALVDLGVDLNGAPAAGASGRLARTALHVAPVGASAGPVRRVAPLRNDAREPQATCVGAEPGSRPDHLL